MTTLFDRFLRWCPGALGLWLRSKVYPYRFGSCGRGVLFGRFIDLYGAERIHLGRKVVISNGVVLSAGKGHGDEGTIYLDEEVFLGSETVLSTAGKGAILIGEGSNFSSYCTVETDSIFRMGRDCLIAGYCRFGEIGECSSPGKDIYVGDGCWLGVRLQVNPGVTIGDNAIVGAHALVEKDVVPFGIAVGSPAVTKKIRGEG
ncbi:DapH/DapD/GlmU-related protein [Desulfopila sp. IMCC35008]|uniref:acyltransferase n=1 Tax=Desulfopila sp. IMCC35008 TaxID=2653858 RepID=UPI0013D8CE6E|nr:DapH/DapD/GlmU-related protein [Desulfopila sp. IMCC35008]